MPSTGCHLVFATETYPETTAPKNPGARNSGMTKRKDPKHAPTIVIGAADLGSQLKKIECAGSKTVIPMLDAVEYGKYAQVTDGEENCLALWQIAKPQWRLPQQFQMRCF